MIRTVFFISFGVLLMLCGKSQSRFAFDFETASTLPKFNAFGTKYELHENPKESDVNASLLVGRIHKEVGKAYRWSGVSVKAPWYVNLKHGGELKMKVFATTKRGKVQVKFSDENNQIRAYSSAYISGLNQWEELTFRFKRNVDIRFSDLVLTFDEGSVEPHIYFFDDITWIAGRPEVN